MVRASYGNNRLRRFSVIRVMVILVVESTNHALIQLPQYGYNPKRKPLIRVMIVFSSFRVYVLFFFHFNSNNCKKVKSKASSRIDEMDSLNQVNQVSNECQFGS